MLENIGFQDADSDLQVRRDYLAWTPHKTEQSGIDPELPQEKRHGIEEHSRMVKSSETSSNVNPHDLPAQGERIEEQEKVKSEGEAPPS